MTIDIHQLKKAAERAMNCKASAPLVKVPLDFTPATVQQYPSFYTDVMKTVSFEWRPVNVDGARAWGLYYHDLLMGVRMTDPMGWDR